MFAVYFLVFPDRLPNIHTAPWDPEDSMKLFWVVLVSMTAKQIQPEMFFLSQISGDEGANMRDFEPYYM